MFSDNNYKNHLPGLFVNFPVIASDLLGGGGGQDLPYFAYDRQDYLIE